MMKFFGLRSCYVTKGMTMKLSVLITIFCLFSTSTFAQSSLDERVKDLEAKVIELEKLIQVKLAKGPLTKTYKGKKETSALELFEWNYIYEKDRSNQYYEIKYSLTNSYNKGIKLIDASIQFKDLLGGRLFGIKVTPDLKLGTGETIEGGGSYRINRFINEELRMKDMSKEDVIATLKVKKIVFIDNTILEM